MIIGLTLAKSVVTNQYPLDLYIDQHVGLGLFDRLVIGGASGDCETADIVRDKMHLYPGYIQYIQGDWNPNSDVAWSQENQYFHLMSRLLYLTQGWDRSDWIFKLDLDEFIHEKDFPEIKAFTEEHYQTTDVLAVLQLGYLFFLGSLRYTTPDPTWQVGKAFRDSCGKMIGDGMQVVPKDGYDAKFFPDIKTYHVGFVKSEDILTRRINEHISNTRSHYPHVKMPLTFTYPKHKDGESAWPLGISGKQFAQYDKFNTDDLPKVLRENLTRFDAYIPQL